MSDRFTVLIADFLDETSIESAILGDIARIVIARARDEAELADHLPLADAILLFHDISILGERSFACARGADAWFAPASATTISTSRRPLGTA